MMVFQHLYSVLCELVVLVVQSAALEIQHFPRGIWEQILRANIGPDMNLHYNLNGIYNLNGMNNHAPDLMKNDAEVQPANIRTDNRGDAGEDIIVGNVPNINGEQSNQGAHQGGPYRFIHDSQVQGSFQHQQNL